MGNSTPNDTLDYYIFVVDTNMYSGDFDRQMGAYITGLEGDYSQTDQIAAMVEKENPGLSESFDGIVERVLNEYGEHPYDIFQDRSGINNSIAIYFSAMPSPQLIDLMMQRAQSFAERRLNRKDFEPNIEIKGYRLLEHHTYLVERALN